ncbi:MAG: glycosyltransferase [Nanoarchaeota archaeon]
MHVVFAMPSIGLGHATRTLPLINATLEDGHRVTVFSWGNALALLKQELKDKVKYHLIPDYDIGFGTEAPGAFDVIIRLPSILSMVRAENNYLRRFNKTDHIDRIVSDGKYGFFLEGTPSFHLINQLRLRHSKFPNIDGNATEICNALALRKFKGILIPDYEENSLGGILDHNPKFFDKKKLHYIGIISGISKKNVAKDIDVFISVSGPGDSRTLFQQKILNEAPSLSGKIVVTLGNPSAEKFKSSSKLTIYSYLNRKQQELMLNRAKLVVSRSGYTTLMELTEIEQNAFFVPIPRQFEQEYLAEYHQKLGHFHYNTQDKFDLVKDIEIAKQNKGIHGMPKTKKTIENFKQLVL